MRSSMLTLCCVLLLTPACLRAVEVELDFSDPDASDALPSAIVKGLDEAYAANAQGLKMLDQGELDGALAQFEDALGKFPGYTDAENNIGVVYFRRGTTSEARRIWAALTAREERYAIAWYNLGVLSFHERNCGKAVSYLEGALKANRQFYEAHLMLGRVQVKQGSMETALEHFKRAYRINGTDSDGWSHYAYALILSGDTATAEQVLGAHADHQESLRMRGMIAAARGQHQRAAELLSAAVEKGASADLLVHMASSQHESGQNQAALKTIEAYLKKMQNRSSADAWLLAGIVAKESGDIAAARRYFQNGHQYYPDDAILSYNLAQVYFHQKDYATAEKLWETLADSLQDPSMYHIRALNAFRQGDLKAAESLTRKALSLDDKAEYYDLLGVVKYRQGDKEKAAGLFKKALRMDPELRSAQLNLALSSTSAADLDKAVAGAEARLSKCTDSCADPAFELAVLYYHQKRFDKAAATLEALPENDRDLRIYRHLSIFYRQTHSLDKAIAALEAADKRFVLDLKTEHELAEVLQLAGYHARAIKVLTGLLEKWEGNRWRLFYQLGYAYMETNNLDKARHYFERSMKAKRDNVAARGLLAYVHNRQGNTGQARKLWSRNLKDDPTNSTLLINLGLSEEQTGNYHAALDYYRKASLVETGNKGLQINIGNAYAGMKQYTDALHAYSLALDSPKRKEAAYNAFLVALRMGNRDKARRMAGILKKEFGSSAFSKRAQGELSLWTGDTTAALAQIRGIPSKDPEDHLQLARIYATQRKPDKAREHLAQVPADTSWKRRRTDVEARIAFAEGKCQRALTLLRDLNDTTFAGRYNVAATAFICHDYSTVLETAKRLVGSARGSDRADICRLAGNAAFALKQWQQARQWYQQLSNIETQDAVVQYNLAVAYYNTNDIEKAWAHYQRAQRLDGTIRNEDIEKRYQSSHAPKDQPGGARTVLARSDSLYNVAVELQEKDSVAAAEKVYRKILADDPEYALAWNNLGALHAARAEFKKAEQYYRRSVQKRHDIPEAYANLVALYLATGNFPQAKRWIIKGRGHNPDSELLATVQQMVDDSLRIEVPDNK